MSTIKTWIKLVEGDQQIRDIIKAEVVKTGMTPAVVNDGYCGFLADNVVARLGRGQVLSTDDTTVDSQARHEWVFVDGKHYDAETPNGVADPNDLRYFRRQARQTKRLNDRK
jgi:hypothetical protein